MSPRVKRDHASQLTQVATCNMSYQRPVPSVSHYSRPASRAIGRSVGLSVTSSAKRVAYPDIVTTSRQIAEPIVSPMQGGDSIAGLLSRFRAFPDTLTGLQRENKPQQMCTIPWVRADCLTSRAKNNNAAIRSASNS